MKEQAQQKRGCKWNVKKKIASLVTCNVKAEANEASCGQSLSPKVTQSQVSEHARMLAAQYMENMQ